MFCPNKSLELYKTVEATFGEDVAYGVFYHIETNRFQQWYDGQLDSQKMPALIDNKFINSKGDSWDIAQFAKQISNRDEVVKKILQLGQGLSKDKEGYLKDGVRVKHRVTEKAKAAAKKRNQDITPEQQKQFDIDAEHGTKIHEFVENISDVIFRGKSKVTLTDKNDIEVYKTLENYFTKFFTELKGQGATVLNEVMIYDEATDTAGTIDVLVVDKNGKISIYDMKTMAFKVYKDADGKQQVSNIHPLKRNEYDMQIGLYKNMIKSVGFKNKDFDKFRIIPINRITNNNKLTGVEVGEKAVVIEDNKPKKVERDYLQMLVVANETTDDEQVNDLIVQYRDKINTISTQIKTSKSREQRQSLYEQQSTYNKLIDALVVKRDYNKVLETAQADLNILKQNIDSLTSEDLNKWQKELKLYVDIDKYIPIDEDEALKTRIALLKFEASQLNNKLDQLINSRIKALAEEQGLSNVLNRPDKELGMWQRWFRGISQINNSIIQIFNRMILDARNKADVDSEELATMINNAATAVGDWAASRGVAAINAYDNLIEETVNKSTGERDIRIIDKYSSKFYEDRKAGKLDKTTLNQQAYDEAYNKYVTNINKQVFDKFNKKKDEALKQQYIDKWVAKNSNINTAPKSMLVIDNPAYISEKWDFINKPENKALLDFYNLYTETIAEMSKFLPHDTIRGGFIPNVKKSLVEQLLKTPESYIKGLPANLLETLKVTDNHGNIINKSDTDSELRIPILYVNNQDTKNKSNNLGVSLMLFAQSALNYKYMTELEDDVKLLQNEINTRPQLLTDIKGNVKQDSLGRPLIGEGNKKAAELLDTAIKFYVYGISDQSKDTEVLGISTKKAVKGLLRYFSTKTLAFNTVSGIVNTLGGLSNTYMQGAKGRFYNNKQMSKSLWMLAKNDETAYKAIKYFDFKMDKNRAGRARALSLSTLDRFATQDKFFFLQHFGDNLTQNGIALSIMQNHTIKDGKVVKIKEGEKTMLEQINNGTTLERTEKLKFEKLVEGVSKSILGNMSTDDMSAIRTTMFGQALMMFRNWIPRTAEERFGELRENQELGGYEIGRYRYFVNGLFSKGVLPAVSELGQRLILFRNPESTREKLKLEYQRAVAAFEADGQELNMTEEEYIELQLGNIKATIMELRMILSVFGAWVALGGFDDEEDKNGFQRYMLRTTDRLYTELFFYLNPIEASRILKSPIAGAGMITDIINFSKYAVLSPFNEQARENIQDSSLKMLPLVNGANQFYNIALDANETLN